ncbi:MAG: cohesin domain-containing protein [Gammaproteobacteria bacterium]|nr:cohesin domain-containing protein [Gammaproteobacteria bacterium]MDH5802876.1 cohesin domain-containing protein [Gammaproteobacteria bacterium]
MSKLSGMRGVGNGVGSGVGSKGLSVVRNLVLVCSLFAAQQSSAILIDFQTSQSTVAQGDSFDVDIIVSGLTAADEIVSAFDLFIGFDDAILSVSNIVFGTELYTGFFQDTDTTIAGQVELVDLSFLFDYELATLQSDSVLLSTITFDALTAGVSELLFLPHPILGGQDVKGRDAAILPLDVGQASITVTASVPEPGTSLLMLAGIIAVFSNLKYPIRS